MSRKFSSEVFVCKWKSSTPHTAANGLNRAEPGLTHRPLSVNHYQICTRFPVLASQSEAGGELQFCEQLDDGIGAFFEIRVSNNLLQKQYAVPETSKSQCSVSCTHCLIKSAWLQENAFFHHLLLCGSHSSRPFYSCNLIVSLHLLFYLCKVELF